jgi:hypothetical protein
MRSSGKKVDVAVPVCVADNESDEVPGMSKLLLALAEKNINEVITKERIHPSGGGFNVVNTTCDYSIGVLRP